MPNNLWNDAEAPGGETLSTLAYRSRLLAADRSVVNIFGGNTSSKALERDHLDREVEVLWVKGSGSDMMSISESGFAGLRQKEVAPLFGREELSDEAMVDYLSRVAFEPNRPRQSIETLLHAFIPYPHVDHTHPDAIISIACAPDGRAIMRDIYGDRAAWVPYIRPGFQLSKMIGQALELNPGLECVVMEKHGLVTWGRTNKECYHNTIRIIQEAEDFLVARSPTFERSVRALDDGGARELLRQVLPVIRGATGGVLAIDRDEDVLDFVGSNGASELSQIGAACPDHLVHTKRVPLYVDWGPTESGEALLDAVRAGLARYQAEYSAYFSKYADGSQAMFATTPRVILIPGLGMITQGKDAFAADISRQLYRRAITVMRNSQILGGFASLSPEESFAVEYWPLELYKLSLKPAPRSLEGRVALVTGGASGIGRAVAQTLASEGAHVVIADIDESRSRDVASEVVEANGFLRCIPVRCDVTSEPNVQAAFGAALDTYGGVDIVVNNAGIASSAPIDETTLEMWNHNQSILATGYFLVAREGFRILKRQDSGGSIVFVVSKNAVAAGKNAAAYSAAKAAELHLARCLAEEGGQHGVRVNSVLPDAVISGSRIWSGRWREERAQTYGISPDELEAHYRQRTTLRVNVYPEDIAAAVLFFASDSASKTTGGVLTVDGGVPTAYVR